MAFARALLLILTGVLLAFGGVARAMPAGEPSHHQPPCHEAPAAPDTGHAPAKATIAVSCCVGCMPAAQSLEPPAGLSRAAAPTRYLPLVHRLQGLALAPEPRPPRA